MCLVKTICKQDIVQGGRGKTSLLGNQEHFLDEGSCVSWTSGSDGGLVCERSG